MKKLSLWVLVFLCLSSLLASAALASRTDRLCYDFDSRSARVKERIAFNEKMLYDDLAGSNKTGPEPRETRSWPRRTKN